MKKSILITLALSLSLFAQETPQEIIETGQKVSGELLKQLGGKLKEKIQTEGLLAAAEFCNAKATTLTEEVNLHQLHGISVKRISLKERNPANKASEEEAKVLQSMEESLAEKKLPAYVVTEDNGVYSYYKPLVIKNGLCLQCHGDLSTNKELEAFYQKHYPQDKATGYKLGDLRGAILVKIKP